MSVPGRATDPLLPFNFSVEVEGLIVGGFTEVTGLGSEIEVHEQPEGGVNGFVHKLPSATRYPNLVLQHGLTVGSTLRDWYESTASGKITRRNGTVLLLDPNRKPLLGWNFRNALPVRWTGPTLDASGTQVGMESIELVHEGLARAPIVRGRT